MLINLIFILFVEDISLPLTVTEIFVELKLIKILFVF